MRRTFDGESTKQSLFSCFRCPFSVGRPKEDVMAARPRVKKNEQLKNLFLARALYDAVEDSNIQQVNLLLTRNRASPNILIPEEGMTPFHFAAGHENLAFGKVATSLFLHNGGDPNVRCEGDRTVLHIGVAWNRSTVVEILLSSTFIVPDPYLKDEDGLNAFNYAVKYNSWEALEALQLFVKKSTNKSVPRNRVKFMEPMCYDTDNSVGKKPQKKNINEESVRFETEFNKSDKLRVGKKPHKKNIIEESVRFETEFNKSDKLHRSSGYFNSNQSVNNVSVSQITNASYESSSSDDSLSDVLNKNISIDYSDSDNNLSTQFSCGKSEVNSINQMNDDYEDLENISFPSESLLADTELLRDDETELTNENNFSQPNGNVSVVNSELMTDISGLSSYVCSDDYYTCPDTNSKLTANRKNDKTDIQQLDQNVTGSFLNLRSDSIIELSTEVKKLNVSENSLSLAETSSLSEISEDYDTDYVRQSLRKYGVPPGPLVPTTKQLYVRKLNRLKKDEIKFKKEDKNIKIVTSGLYSCYLTKVLIDNAFDLWKETIKSWAYLEKDIINSQSGTSFTYLLLDPRITKNLPVRAEKMRSPIRAWQTFISSIFYIGKGTKSRPNDHMMEAFNSWVGTNTRDMSQKTEYIINLWKEDTGVVCVQAFHHLTSNEAHIREATMIDAIGLDRLTNEKRGTYYDKTLRWRYSDRCKLGCYLLFRAFHVFLADGERQLRPVDLT